MSELLRLSGVTLRRGGRLLTEGLDLRLAAGEALHLSGPNGSGKSSLIRLIAGLLRAESGEVASVEAALADDALALDGELSLGRAIGFWARLAGKIDRLEEAMEAVGIAHLADVPVRLLSAGQAKRASLARVAASSARLWLLDEPLNALDSDGVARLDALIGRHRASGGAVVAASHSALGGDWRRLELGK
ncbi:MAG TPA: heme ABC exporter ATP-binding protein CcmA [Sphingomicrobium sp.]|jgi:heme exporter protein A|nr:heme ABC exporter ATP-binding protein CcmA [Sphingomicrobium sp.]